MRQLAKQLGLSPSTVSREIARNGGRCAYRAAISDARAWERTLRPKQCVLAGNSSLREIVAQKLQEDWSPQQIAGWLKRTYQNDSAMQLSHETIYRSLFIQARGILNWLTSTILTARRQLSWPVEAGNELNSLLA
jgi:IS30 family transposase